MTVVQSRRLMIITLVSVLAGVAIGLLEYAASLSVAGALCEGVLSAYEVFKTLRDERKEK